MSDRCGARWPQHRLLRRLSIRAWQGALDALRSSVNAVRTPKPPSYLPRMTLAGYEEDGQNPKETLLTDSRHDTAARRPPATVIRTDSILVSRPTITGTSMARECAWRRRPAKRSDGHV